mmetsp:Transcript_72384/g.145664  ORF Transcript_72384/g.145664 Transcript_72384/m.145664 type:complete len:121 (-) Transcript_72384:98-460(-)
MRRKSFILNMNFEPTMFDLTMLGIESWRRLRKKDWNKWVSTIMMHHILCCAQRFIVLRRKPYHATALATSRTTTTHAPHHHHHFMTPHYATLQTTPETIRHTGNRPCPHTTLRTKHYTPP